MENKNELLDKIIASPIGDLPIYRVNLYIVSNAYLTCVERNYLEEAVNPDLVNYANDVNSYLSEKDQTIIKNLFGELSKEGIVELVKIALTSKETGIKTYNEASSGTILDITEAILDIDGAGHMVYDLGSGSGTALARFLLSAQNKGYVLKDLTGDEVNVEQARISQMALAILSNGKSYINIRIGNALDNKKILFSRGYCYPSFGIKGLIREKSKRSELFKNIEFNNRTTSEWVFIDKLLSGMIENGKAVAIVAGRALFSDVDKDYRNELLKHGLIESIIELPSGTLAFTGVKPYLIVFSHNNNEVKLLDCSGDIYLKSRKLGKTEVNVDAVLAAYRTNNNKKNINELIDVSALLPSVLLAETVEPKNGIKLKEVAEVFTGSQYTLRNFEDMLTDEQTGYKILTSGDIEGGIVEWNKLRRINYKDSKFDKFAVKKDDVVITSKSSKVKTVVVDIEPKDKILVTGGMIIVRPDVKKLNPTFLKIFLDSPNGQNALKCIQKGTVIVSINAKDLSEIKVPCVDISKQNSKAEKYNEKLSTLYAYKLEVQKLEDSLQNFYSDEDED